MFTPASAPAGPAAPAASAKSTGGFGAPMRADRHVAADEGGKPGADAVTFQVPVLRPMIE